MHVWLLFSHLILRLMRICDQAIDRYPNTIAHLCLSSSAARNWAVLASASTHNIFPLIRFMHELTAQVFQFVHFACFVVESIT